MTTEQNFLDDSVNFQNVSDAPEIPDNFVSSDEIITPETQETVDSDLIGIDFDSSIPESFVDDTKPISSPGSMDLVLPETDTFKSNFIQAETKPGKRYDWFKNELLGLNDDLYEIYTSGYAPEDHIIHPLEKYWSDNKIKEPFVRAFGEDEGFEKFSKLYESSKAKFDLYKDLNFALRSEKEHIFPFKTRLSENLQKLGYGRISQAAPVDIPKEKLKRNPWGAYELYSDNFAGYYTPPMKGWRQIAEERVLYNGKVYSIDEFKSRFHANGYVYAVNPDGTPKTLDDGMGYLRPLMPGEEKKTWEEYYSPLLGKISNYFGMNGLETPDWYMFKFAGKSLVNFVGGALTSVGEFAKALDNVFNDADSDQSDWDKFWTDFNNFYGSALHVPSSEKAMSDWTSTEGLVDIVSDVAVQLLALRKYIQAGRAFTSLFTKSAKIQNAVGSGFGRFMLSAYAAQDVPRLAKEGGFTERETALLYTTVLGGFMFLQGLSEAIVDPVKSRILTSSIIRKSLEPLKALRVSGRQVTEKSIVQAGKNVIDSMRGFIRGAYETGSDALLSQRGLGAYITSGILESAEEVSELIWEKSVMEFGNILPKIGVFTRPEGEKDPRFNITWERFPEELAMSAVAGFAGGMIARGLIRKDVIDTKTILSYGAVPDGYKKLRNVVQRLYDKNLLVPDGDVDIYGQKTDDITKTRSYLVYKALMSEIDAAEDLWKSYGMAAAFKNVKDALAFLNDESIIKNSSIGEDIATRLAKISELKARLINPPRDANELNAIQSEITKLESELEQIKDGSYAGKYYLYQNLYHIYLNKLVRNRGKFPELKFEELYDRVKSYENSVNLIRNIKNNASLSIDEVLQNNLTVPASEEQRLKQELLAKYNITIDPEIGEFIYQNEEDYKKYLEESDKLEKLIQNVPEKEYEVLLTFPNQDGTNGETFEKLLAAELEKASDETVVYDDLESIEKIENAILERLFQAEMMGEKALNGDFNNVSKGQFDPLPVLSEDDLRDLKENHFVKLLGVANALKSIVLENRENFYKAAVKAWNSQISNFSAIMNSISSSVANNPDLQELHSQLSTILVNFQSASSSDEQMKLFLDFSQVLSSWIKDNKSGEEKSVVDAITGYTDLFKSLNSIGINDDFQMVKSSVELPIHEFLSAYLSVLNNMPDDKRTPSPEQFLAIYYATTFLVQENLYLDEFESTINQNTNEVEFLAVHNGFFVNGKQGSGKTMVAGMALRVAQQIRGSGKVAVIALNESIRSKNVEELKKMGVVVDETINRPFKFEDLMAYLNNADNLKELGFIYIDEATLFNKNELHAIDKAVSRINSAISDKKQHIRILFTGDVYQLGAVNSENAPFSLHDNAVLIERTRPLKFSFRTGNQDVLAFLQHLDNIRRSFRYNVNLPSVSFNYDPKELKGVLITDDFENAISDFLKNKNVQNNEFVIITTPERIAQLRQKFGNKIPDSALLTPLQAQGGQWKYVITDQTLQLDRTKPDADNFYNLRLTTSVSGRASRMLIITSSPSLNAVSGEGQSFGREVAFDKEEDLDKLRESHLQYFSNIPVQQPVQKLTPLNRNVQVSQEEDDDQIVVIKRPVPLDNNLLTTINNVLSDLIPKDADTLPLFTFYTEYTYIDDNGNEVFASGAQAREAQLIKRQLFFPGNYSGLPFNPDETILSFSIDTNTKSIVYNKVDAKSLPRNTAILKLTAKLYKDGNYVGSVVIGSLTYTSVDPGMPVISYDLSQSESQILMNVLRSSIVEAEQNKVDPFKEEKKLREENKPVELKSVVPLDEFIQNNPFFNFSSDVYSILIPGEQKRSYVFYSFSHTTEEIDNILLTEQLSKEEIETEKLSSTDEEITAKIIRRAALENLAAKGVFAIAVDGGISIPLVDLMAEINSNMKKGNDIREGYILSGRAAALLTNYLVDQFGLDSDYLDEKGHDELKSINYRELTGYERFLRKLILKNIKPGKTKQKIDKIKRSKTKITRRKGKDGKYYVVYSSTKGSKVKKYFRYNSFLSDLYDKYTNGSPSEKKHAAKLIDELNSSIYKYGVLITSPVKKKSTVPVTSAFAPAVNTSYTKYSVSNLMSPAFPIFRIPSSVITAPAKLEAYDVAYISKNLTSKNVKQSSAPASSTVQQVQPVTTVAPTQPSAQPPASQPAPSAPPVTSQRTIKTVKTTVNGDALQNNNTGASPETIVSQSVTTANSQTTVSYPETVDSDVLVFVQSLSKDSDTGEVSVTYEGESSSPTSSTLIGFYRTWFSDRELLPFLREFNHHFKSLIYNTMFNLHSDKPTVVSWSMVDSVLKSLRNAIESKLKQIPPDVLSDESKRKKLMSSGDIKFRQLVYDYIILNEFDFLLKSFFPGIVKVNGKYKFSRTDINEGVADFDNNLRPHMLYANEIIRLHLYNTPIVVGSGNNAKITRTMGRDDIAILIKAFSENDLSTPEKIYNFFNVRTVLNQRDLIYRSFFLRFLNQNPERINGVSYNSFYRIGQFDFVQAIISYLRSGAEVDFARAKFSQNSIEFTGRLSDIETSFFRDDLEASVKSVKALSSMKMVPFKVTYSKNTRSNQETYTFTINAARKRESVKVEVKRTKDGFFINGANGAKISDADLQLLLRTIGLGTFSFDQISSLLRSLSFRSSVFNIAKYLHSGKLHESVFQPNNLNDWIIATDFMSSMKMNEYAYGHRNLNGDRQEKIITGFPLVQINSELQRISTELNTIPESPLQANPLVRGDLKVKGFLIKEGFINQYGNVRANNLMDTYEQFYYDFNVLFLGSLSRQLTQDRQLPSGIIRLPFNVFTYSDKKSNFSIIMSGDFMMMRNGMPDIESIKRRAVNSIIEHKQKTAIMVYNTWVKALTELNIDHKLQSIPFTSGETTIKQAYQNLKNVVSGLTVNERVMLVRTNLVNNLMYKSGSYNVDVEYDDVGRKITETVKLTGVSDLNDEVFLEADPTYIHSKIEKDYVDFKTYVKSQNLNRSDIILRDVTYFYADRNQLNNALEDIYFWNWVWASHAFTSVMLGDENQYKDLEDMVKRASQITTNRHKMTVDMKSTAYMDGSSVRPVPVTKVISGGQTGADQMALNVVAQLNNKYGNLYATGGTMADGFATESGARPEFAQMFNMRAEGTYSQRTERNVVESDATVIFATNPNSPGTRETIYYLNKHKKPFLINPSSYQELRLFLKQHNVSVLNVAGNRMSVMSESDLNKYSEILSKALEPDSAFIPQNVSQKQRLKFRTITLADFTHKWKAVSGASGNMKWSDGLSYYTPYSLLKFRKHYGNAAGFTVGAVLKPISSYMNPENGVSRYDKYASFLITPQMIENGDPFIQSIYKMMLRASKFSTPVVYNGNTYQNLEELDRLRETDGLSFEQIFSIIESAGVDNDIVMETAFTSEVKTGLSKYNDYGSMDMFIRAINDPSFSGNNFIPSEPVVDQRDYSAWGLVFNPGKPSDANTAKIGTQFVTTFLQNQNTLYNAANILEAIYRIGEIERGKIESSDSKGIEEMLRIFREGFFERGVEGIVSQIINSPTIPWSNREFLRNFFSSASSFISQKTISFEVMGGQQVLSPATGVWRVRPDGLGLAKKGEEGRPLKGLEIYDDAGNNFTDTDLWKSLAKAYSDNNYAEWKRIRSLVDKELASGKWKISPVEIVISPIHFSAFNIPDGTELADIVNNGEMFFYNNDKAKDDVRQKKLEEGYYKHQYNEFLKTLDIVIGRVPATFFQSIIRARVVGFSNGSQNTAYVHPDVLIYQGADHDVDKGNILAYEPDDDGNIIIPENIQQAGDNIVYLKNFIVKNMIDGLSNPAIMTVATLPTSTRRIDSLIEANKLRLSSKGRYNPVSANDFYVQGTYGKTNVGIHAAGIKVFSPIIYSVNNGGNNFSMEFVSPVLRGRRSINTGDLDSLLMFSEYLNAAVDNAKDPKLGKIKVDKINAGIVNTLIMFGYDENQIYNFLNSKPISEIYDVYRKSLRFTERKLKGGLLGYVESLIDKDISIAPEVHDLYAILSFQSTLFNLVNIFSINKETPSSMYDLYKYMKAISHFDMILRSQLRSGKEDADAAIDPRYSLRNFILNMDDEGRKQVLDEIKKTYSGLTLHELLFYNKHYMSYIKSMYLLIDTMSKSEMFKSVINAALSMELYSENEFNDLVDLMYALMVDGYLFDTRRSSVKMGGVEYDLTSITPTSTGKKSRIDFIRDFPNYLNRVIPLKEETLLNYLRTQIINDVILVKPEGNVREYSPETRFKVAQLLSTADADIRTFEGDNSFTDLLFLYALISDKGRVSGSSITGILDYDASELKSFDNYVDNNAFRVLNDLFSYSPENSGNLFIKNLFAHYTSGYRKSVNSTIKSYIIKNKAASPVSASVMIMNSLSSNLSQTYSFGSDNNYEPENTDSGNNNPDPDSPNTSSTTSANLKYRIRKSKYMNTPYKRLIGKKVSVEMIQNTLEFLKKKFELSGITVNYRLMTSQEIASEFGSEMGNLKGFVDDKNNIVINTDLATADTPIHEFIEVWMPILKQVDPELYNQIVNESLKDPYSEVIRKAYPEIADNDEAVAIETFATIAGIENTAKIYNASGKGFFSWISNLYDRFMRWLNNLLKDLFGVDVMYGDTLFSLVDRVGESLINSPMLSLTAESRQILYSLGINMSSFRGDLSVIRTSLKLQGRYQKIC